MVIIELSFYFIPRITSAPRAFLARVLGQGDAALDHEILDHPVEARAIIKALLRQGLKILDSFRSDIGPKLHDHVTLVGLDNCNFSAHSQPRFYYYSGQKTCRFNVVQLREFLLEVSISFHLYAALVGRLAITAVYLINYVHPFGHLAERREPLAIQTGIVAEINKELRRPGVGTGGGESDRPARVAGLDGIVR